MWPLGPTRFDAWLWAGGLAALVVGTLLAGAGGARLGAALTLGVGLLVAVVVVGMLVQEYRRPVPTADDDDPPDEAPGTTRDAPRDGSSRARTPRR